MVVDRKWPIELMSTNVSGVTSDIKFRKGQRIFKQGDPADAAFYIQEGRLKVTVLSQRGKAAVIAILGAGEFCGEGCLSRQTQRVASAVAMTDCIVSRLEKAAMTCLMREDRRFSEYFLEHLISRQIRLESEHVNLLFNSSEKRLARLLLILADVKNTPSRPAVISAINQETLAEMIGATRSRVSFFMNKFRQLGFIDYNNGIEVHNSLLSVLLLGDPAPWNDN